MSDDLKQLMFLTRDEGPPADFAASLRSSLIEQAHQLDQAGDSGITVLDVDFERSKMADARHFSDDLYIDLPIVGVPDGDDSPGYQRWVAAAVAVVALLGVGLWVALSDGQQQGLETITPPEMQETSSTIPLPEESPFDDDRQVNDAPTAVESVGGVISDLEESSSLESGVYQSSTLGTPLSIDSLGSFEVLSNRDASLRLVDGAPITQGNLLRIDRVSELSDPVRPEVPFSQLEQSWPVDDVRNWLAQLDSKIAASAVEETMLGSSSALMFELVPDLASCPIDEPCGYFSANHGLNELALFGGSNYSVWVVDQGTEDPIAVVLQRQDSAVVQESSDAVLGAVTFGSPEPNPVQPLPEGVFDLGLFEGLQLDNLAEEVTITNSDGYLLIGNGGFDANTAFIARPRDLDGVSVTSADQLSAILTELAIEVTDLGSTQIDGVDARVFDIQGEGQRGLLVDRFSEFAWLVPSQGRLWAIEHPGRGFLLISAAAKSSDADEWPAVLERTEHFVANLEFIVFSGHDEQSTLSRNCRASICD